MRPDYDRLFNIAIQQGGYFTTEQARLAGVASKLVWHHARRGRFTRVHRGLYRLRQYPPSPDDHIIEAWLAAGSDALVSHESALSLHRLSNVIPASVHLTVPRTHRWAGRRVPRGVTLHTTTRPLRREHVVVRGPLRVTAPARSIVDAAEAGTAPEQILQAVRQALEQGLATRATLLSIAEERSRRVTTLIRRGIEEASAA